MSDDRDGEDRPDHVRLWPGGRAAQQFVGHVA